MRVHFFNRISLPYRYSFQNYYTLQNLQTIKTVSSIYFIINVVVRLLLTLGSPALQNIKHINDLNTGSWVSTILSPLFYIGSILLIRYFNDAKRFLYLAHLFTVLFGLFVLISGMRATF